MNDNDLLSAVNKVLRTHFTHIADASVAQLVRASLIIQLDHVSECHPTDAPKTDEQTLFYKLEPGARFHRVGEGRIWMKKALNTQVGVLCPRDCPAGEAWVNASHGESTRHFCPDTPVTEDLI